jgi:hypothetical protein
LKKIILSLALLGSFFNCRAATVISVSPTGDINPLNYQYMGQQFTTDSNSYSNLTFTLGLANYQATSQGSFTVGLYRGDDGNVPGTRIAFLGISNPSFFSNHNSKSLADLNPSDFQSVSFTNNALSLAANTTYWVAVGNDGAQNFTWDSFNPATRVGSGTYGLAYVNSTGSVNPNTVFDLKITSTAVPEPSTYALFGLGALALVVAYRRKVA